MAELLPAIDIAISVDTSLFLSRMIELGAQTGIYAIERSADQLVEPRMDVVNFRLQAENQHKGHGFQLIARSELPERVDVEVRAERWSPDPPTRAVYIEAARDLAGSLLKQYNRTYGTRHRLRIRQSAGKPFKPSAHTNMLLRRFTMLANQRALHPYDWQRFYGLVRNGRQEIPAAEMRAYLVEAGFTSVRAAEFTEIYAHLWAFKRFR